MMRFQSKVAIVTGGNSGIGKEVAARFIAEGGSVVINGRDAAKAELAAKEIDPSGERVAVHVGDVTLPATGDSVVKAALARFGRLDVLFNNAGVFGPKPFLDITEAEFDRFLDINLKGKFFVAQAAAKAMKALGAEARSCKPAQCGHHKQSAQRPPRPTRQRKRVYMPSLKTWRLN
jgi:NAD(P)-dependent dehydrogenase (short-subunit alcohol dehydrogenase family)